MSRAEQSRAEQSRYLYAVKALASFLVVALHIKSGYALINGISRCAVLTFFMISGYYTTLNSYGLQETLKRRIKKLLWILLTATFVYFLKDLLVNFLHNEDLLIYLKTEFSAYKVAKVLVFDDWFIRLHLWFILGMIYLYVVLLVIKHFDLLGAIIHFQIPLIITLFAVNILMGELAYFIGIDTPVCFVRNWFLTGFPAFLLGNRIRSSEKKHSGYLLAGLCVVGALESWMAFAKLGRGDTYLGSILLAYSLVYGVKIFSAAAKCTLLSYIGSTCSLAIYLYHILVAEILPDISGKVIIVYLVCICFTMAYRCALKIKEKMLES